MKDAIAKISFSLINIPKQDRKKELNWWKSKTTEQKEMKVKKTGKKNN